MSQYVLNILTSFFPLHFPSLETMAEFTIENIIPVCVGALLTFSIAMITRFINRADKKEEEESEREIQNIATMNELRAINKELGRHESSEAKQWTTLDANQRDISDLKTRVGILESKSK